MLKIVWICHLTNPEIQQKINARKAIISYAPWISTAIDEIKKREDIELHLISPHRWISGLKKYSEKNVYYYFFNEGIPLYGRHWPAFFRFDYLTNFYLNRLVIKRIINKVKPDLINLHGIENPYYSYAILDYKKYPVLITIQGLNSLNLHNIKNKSNQHGIKLEQRLLMEFDNFGIRVDFLKTYIQKINPNANFYWFKYPFASNALVNSASKQYDCVYFATLSKEKGIEDLINAIYLVKNSIQTISLKIIGTGSPIFKQYLVQLVRKLNLHDNIEFIGFLDSHEDVYKLVSQARISILPTYNDILPGTIIESLKLGIPVIAYAANGVVDFNKNGDIIKLIKIGDIEELAISIVSLLNNDNERNRMSKAGTEEIAKNFSNTEEVQKMVSAYKFIIKNHIKKLKYNNELT